ncbi:outer membrane protein [Sedimentitalea sp. HM32M-2]|uniref:outer membrane protein n=1 Tax=Sedimentitalea sp. HM32M-2 TaxID=3351566 RepID=UPI00362AE25A
MFLRMEKPVRAAAMALVLGGAAATAQAGNVAPVPADPAVITPAPVWRGVYAGASVAYAFNGDDRVGHRNPGGAMVAVPGTLEQSGVNYGLRLGWRGERSQGARSFVYGVELGYDAGKADDSLATATHTASVSLNNVLSLRLKSGLTNAARNTLFYGILGYARGDFDYAVAGTAAGDTIAINTGLSANGYVLGLGAERQLTDRLSLFGEWEYLNFGSQRLTDANGSSTQATPKYQNIRIGLNYRF